MKSISLIITIFILANLLMSWSGVFKQYSLNSLYFSAVLGWFFVLSYEIELYRKEKNKLGE